MTRRAKSQKSAKKRPENVLGVCHLPPVDGKTRIIDRTTRLKAENGKVDITDNKEGMFAIRLTRELELPSRGKVKLTDYGQITQK